MRTLLTLGLVYALSDWLGWKLWVERIKKLTNTRSLPSCSSAPSTQPPSIQPQPVTHINLASLLDVTVDFSQIPHEALERDRYG